MKKLISIVFIFLAFSLVSYADFYTGNTLLLKISYEMTKVWTQEAIEWFQAQGYILGIFDAYEGVYYDAPEGMVAGQIQDIAVKYLKNHPETRHYNAFYLATSGFSRGFS